MNSATVNEKKRTAHMLLARRVDGDRLMLADAVLAAALDGRRALTANERAALDHSPLTLRRLRTLSLARGASAPAANDPRWHGSAGMLRAASGGAPLAWLGTDDQCWSLHFVEHGGGWRLILKLAPEAPFLARLMRERPVLRVVDGAGATLLQGSLDADGECECGWPFATAPAPHLQRFGAIFAVEPIKRGRRDGIV